MTARARPAPVVPEPRLAFPDDLIATLGPLDKQGRLAVGVLLLLVGAGGGAYIYQLINGLRVTGLGDFVSWGVYMANFIFFIGISYAGTLISAVLRLTGAEWRRPITRVAECITVVALLIGGGMIIADMGRPDRLLHIPMFGRVQSPVIWDVLSITTYLSGSILYLYVAMIPDLAILARTPGADGLPTWRTNAARILSLGFRATPSQMKHFDKALGAMAIVLIPVAVSAHSVVAWIFGTTLRPGWHSTIFAPYFVVGAIFSGTAALIVAAAVFRRLANLDRYLTLQHFRYLGWILLALAALYGYFTFAEYLTSWYGGEVSDSRLLRLLFHSSTYGVGFWTTVVAGILVPMVLLVIPGVSLARIVTASVLVVLAMWLKRYLIVVPTLLTPFLPIEAAGITPRYVPTLTEWLVTLGGGAAFVLAFGMLAKLVPIVSIWETGETDPATAAKLHAILAEPMATRGRRPRPGPIFRVLVPVLALGLTAYGSRLTAQTDSARIQIAREAEGHDVNLVATVTFRGKPVKGATVAFYVRRTFGLMTAGEDVTLEDGSAAVAYPTGLVGGPTGTLTVFAEVKAPAQFEGQRDSALVTGAASLPERRNAFPRALWAPRGPLGMIATLAVLLLLVWGTYGFVALSLWRIHTLAVEGETAHVRTAFDPDPDGDGFVHRGLDVHAHDRGGRAGRGSGAVGRA